MAETSTWPAAPGPEPGSDEAIRRDSARAIWAEWEANGSPSPPPPVRLPLTLAECAARFGTYEAVGPDGEPVAAPVVHGFVELVDCLCPRTGAACPNGSTGLEYGGRQYCNRDCAALDQPDHPRLANHAERAAERMAAADRAVHLREQLAAIEAELAGSS